MLKLTALKIRDRTAEPPNPVLPTESRKCWVPFLAYYAPSYANVEQRSAC